MKTLVEQIAARLVARTAMLSVAESCTGGWLSQILTSVPGSSRWFERGYITYSNLAKQQSLGVHSTTLEKHGAVSAATVLEMASGVLEHSPAQFGIAITGIAGPDGGTIAKPVGTVFIGWAERGSAAEYADYVFPGDRTAIRQQAVEQALRGLLSRLNT